MTNRTNETPRTKNRYDITRKTPVRINQPFLNNDIIEDKTDLLKTLYFDGRSLLSWLSLADHANVPTIDTRILGTIDWNHLINLQTCFNAKNPFKSAIMLYNPHRRTFGKTLAGMRPGSTLVFDHMPKSPLQQFQGSRGPYNNRPQGTIRFGKTLLPDLCDHRISKSEHRPQEPQAIMIECYNNHTRLLISSEQNPGVNVPVVWRIYLRHEQITGISMIHRHAKITQNQADTHYAAKAAVDAAGEIANVMVARNIMPWNPTRQASKNTPQNTLYALDFAITENRTPLLQAGYPQHHTNYKGDNHYCNFGTKEPVGYAI